jgi:isopentenyldiphosphate isomerase
MTSHSNPAERAEEWVDIVDADDNVVGTVTRRTMREQVLRHRATYIFVMATNGSSILVHQRAATKDLWPSRWDLAVGGVVSAGESYDRSAARELLEEVGIAAALTPIGSLRYDADDGLVNGAVYVARHDGPFTFTDGEVARAEWLAFDRLDAVIGQREWCDDTLSVALPLLMAHLRSEP